MLTTAGAPVHRVTSAVRQGPLQSCITGTFPAQAAQSRMHSVAGHAAQACSPCRQVTPVPAQAFLQPEQLGSSDSWYCPHCKAHVQADKKLDLWTLPEVLIVHLKRFSFSRTRRTKLDNPVTFPLHGLDLSPYLLRQQVGLELPDPAPEASS